jgi:glycerol-3-phosphate dehydrogenase (NAD(P)+)
MSGRIGILGAGSWGTALAVLLGHAGRPVTLWGRDAARLSRIKELRRNEDYLPGVELPGSVEVVEDLGRVAAANWIVVTTPSAHVRGLARRLAAFSPRPGLLVSCAKGIELDSGLRMTEVIGQELGDVPLAVLTGPNHAEEVADRKATAAVLACADEALALEAQGLFSAPWFRCYTTTDVAGAEWGGASKNPYALAAGMAAGLRLGDNAIAALVTRALAEMVRLGTAAGGRLETFYGLSGVGDLVATCYSRHSRNFRLGEQLGLGRELAEVQAGSRMVAEGVPNTRSLRQTARRLGARTPLLDEVHAVLFEGKTPAGALRDLLARDPRPEAD